MKWFNRLEEALISFLLAAMTLLTFLQVVLRYVFNSGLIWALEATTYMFGWMVLLGISYGIKVGSHIGVDVIVQQLPPRGRRLVGLLVALLSILYFGLIESDRYVSEAKFVVRAPSTAALGQIANVLQGSGIVKSADDAYVVHGYLESRDALLELSKNSGLEEMFGRPEADILSRYPKFYRKANVEDLYKHYLKFVYLDYNQTTGISLLRVQAFRPKDAHDLAAAMLDNAEVLINRLNERAQQDAI